ncbi:PREDICTED: intercellular adhesion molecule 5-like [Gekko japonicus]|uniref:Intercellular adhesion molecule 5-like n=1 Tax=Gekko japonicus TaxID=146911 RepID=A0ABM1L3D5_GEKJA|nr:PREDICTED: intercellular adhesion molecule 5-like [Gekko japonicus]
MSSKDDILSLDSGAQEQPFVSAWPENPVVEFGNSLVLNCSTGCRNVLSGGLETNLDKEIAGEGRAWKAFQLVNVSSWDPAPSCYFDCADAADMKPHRVNFTVYRPPTVVKLDLVPAMEVGKEYTLTCRVSDVAPIRNLSVTFLKGGEKLHLQTFEKHAAREAGDVVASHTVTAGQQDNGEEISCRAALDLRPDGPLFETTSHNQSLKAVVFPSDPRLSLPRYVEANTSELVTCEVTGVSPAQEAQFELTFAEDRLVPDVEVWGDTARAQAQVSPSVAGNHSLKCTVSLGPVTRTAEVKVNVYNGPQMNESSCPGTVTWKAGSEETFTCSAWGNPSPNVTCRKDGVHYPLGVPQLITANHRGSYNCSASNEYGSVAAVVTVGVEVYEVPALPISLGILAALVLASIAGVGYYMYHKAYKTKEYQVAQRKAQGNPSEKQCLNGKVQTDSSV